MLKQKTVTTKKVKSTKGYNVKFQDRLETKVRLVREKHPSFSEENYDEKGNQKDLFEMMGLK